MSDVDAQIERLLSNDCPVKILSKILSGLNVSARTQGNAIIFTRVENILKETEWTSEEVFKLALEARENEYVTLSMKTGYRVGDNDPESHDLIGLWNNVYMKMGTKRKALAIII